MNQFKGWGGEGSSGSQQPARPLAPLGTLHAVGTGSSSNAGDAGGGTSNTSQALDGTKIELVQGRVSRLRLRLPGRLDSAAGCSAGHLCACALELGVLSCAPFANLRPVFCSHLSRPARGNRATCTRSRMLKVCPLAAVPQHSAKRGQ